MLEGHRLDPTARFGSRVDDYRRFRPDYPPGILTILNEQLGFNADWVVADVGSGTGLLTELFLRQGNTVHAVEPNGPMRQAGEEALGGFSNFYSIAGSAEATALPAASIDLIVAGQAFHWFEQQATGREWRRIARGRGWTALVWNERDLDASPFMRDYEALMQRGATGYDKIVHRGFEQHLKSDFFNGSLRVFELAHRQVLNREGLLGRLFSSSYMPQAGVEGYETVRREADDLFQTYAREDRIELIYRTRLFLGALSP